MSSDGTEGNVGETTKSRRESQLTTIGHSVQECS